MLGRRIQVHGSRVLILGLSFKENCPDLRNSKVIDVIAELRDHGFAVDVHDPWVDPAAALHECGLDLLAEPPAGQYDGIILTVAHDDFVRHGAKMLRGNSAPEAVLYDLKRAVAPADSDMRL